ncbi:steroid receptor-associated and regulated protein [Bubalus bubalis]|uniref:steroid receptor-associated and regulated protein n=1 Tax=Bubalus bubalis TaxID=89462 RepID=UPI00042CBF3B|nr:steroid receptor-associated and regulated protein [Bubalus bubalis]
MAAVTAPSEDTRDPSAHPGGLETNLETSSEKFPAEWTNTRTTGAGPVLRQHEPPALCSLPSGRPARRQKAVPGAHLTFVIDCARGKQISLAAPPGPPRTPGPNPGPAVPLMKTYILLCGEKQSPNLTPEAPLGGGGLAQAGGPCRGTTAPASPPASPEGLAEAPEAKGSPVKAVSSRSSAWGTVIGSLKALSSCVCAQAD